MKKLLFIAGVAVISCCSAKKITGTGNNKDPETSVVISNEDNAPDTSLPACIKKMMKQFQEEEKQNPPRSIYRYMYNGKIVYYVPAICCDFFSDLYDSKCNLIGHPDGGFTGKGDGKTPDFMEKKMNEKLIWKDKRQ